MTESEWGWVRYERTFWKQETGEKCYTGHFRKDNDPYNWTLCRVKFWAHRPVVAMREICNSGKDPKEFAGKVIN